MHCHPNIFHSDSRGLFGIFILPTRKAHVFVLDRVRTNQMPNLTSHYHSERSDRLTKFPDNYIAPPDGFTFDLRVDTEIRRVSETVLF
jgi:DNA polymerase epsilon subunit 1